MSYHGPAPSNLTSRGRLVDRLMPDEREDDSNVIYPRRASI